MNSLLEHKDHIFAVKNRVKTRDPCYYEHIVINPREIIDKTISIVMASSNRSRQTYFTLLSMVKNKGHWFQIIIVDDSDVDPVDPEVLRTYPFYIDLIRINRANKDWHNPLVNYNIGFQFIKGSKVVIQNAEVCHVGRLLDLISEGLEDDEYYVFDVRSSVHFDTNEQIYKHGVADVSVYDKDFCGIWYQGRELNRKFHFLTAMTRETFDLIEEFSYDCTMGCSYDDDDLVLKIESLGINIVNMFYDECQVGGIHLFHAISTDSWDRNREVNEHLFKNKKRVWEETKQYIDTTKNPEHFDEQYQKLVVS
jgi:hypothetical protein